MAATGFHNTASGFKALFNDVTGFGNTANGFRALYNNDKDSAGSANGNTAMGDQSLFSNVDGSENTGIGRAALLNNSNSRNTAIGANSMLGNTTGLDNTGVGWSSLESNSTGNFNSVLGYLAGSNVTGSNNTAIGANSNIAANVNTATAIGAGATANANNATAIGAGATATGVNQVVIGNASVTTVALPSGAKLTIGATSIVGAGTSNISGNLNVTGAITAGTKDFKIDHPLDPANKYLYHTSVESPDMLNIYNGNAVLDSKGEANIRLPDWFEALNKDFRYQLTPIGGFAPVYIEDEISGNSFKIAGGRPGLKVSWQVTGIRKDPYAELHRTPVEENKPESERGTYLYPDAYGQPRYSSIPKQTEKVQAPPFKPKGN
jgi:hypothetical protein